MTYYRRVGEVPAKRHTLFTDSTGTRRHEELFGHEGFSSRSALLYHRHPPSVVVDFAAISDEDRQADEGASFDHPAVPRHLRTAQIADAADMVGGRRILLRNDQLAVGFVRASGTSSIYRNALGDELLYIQRGQAVLESVFGSMPVGAGDYVVLPAGTTHRWRVIPGCDVEALVVEARGHVGVPARYLSAGGQFLEHAPFCERDLRCPNEPHLEDGENVDVIVRAAGGLTRMTHRHHPFDVVGWDGALYPWAFNIADFEPIVGRIHQPPPVHQTFDGPGFVVCSFVPRLYDFHPDAVKVPYAHSNVDSEEILFYSAGQFMSRAGSGIDVGSLSYHPAGFIHGPQPGSYEASVDRASTEEVAVMIDTFAPLRVTDLARRISAPDYPATWARMS